MRSTRRLQPKRGVFLIICLLMAFCIFHKSTKNVKKERAILYARLHTIDDANCGVGNHVFEVLSLIGIAKMLNRKPMMSPKVFHHFQSDHAELVNAMSAVDVLEHPPTIEVPFAHDCCHFADPINVFEEYAGISVRTKLKYAQSFRYFELLSKEEVSKVLQLDHSVAQFAEHYLVDPDLLQGHNLCLHIRRGDFMKDDYLLPSNEKFVVAAIAFLSKKIKSNSQIIVFGGDTWIDSVLGGKFPYTKIGSFVNAKYPPTAEWRFSQVHCDTVLLTASASTFGWWIGYFSRGQSVYFNKDHDKGTSPNEYKEVEYFPQQWTALKLEANGTIYDAKRDL